MCSSDLSDKFLNVEHKLSSISPMLNVEGLRSEKCGGVRTHYAGGWPEETCLISGPETYSHG